MNPLISVIVPVYNVEKYLDRCLKSIAEQTYKNLEIILVNDGSPDNSGKICDEWAKKDPRIKVFHKDNGGAGDTRNYGVEKATGEYIAFVDSDDVIADNYFEFLYDNLVKYDADISCCDFFEFRENESPEFKSAEISERVISGYDACKKMLESEVTIVLVSPCCKICKSEIIKSNPFPTGHACEDEATSCKYYYYSKKVVMSNAKLYAYYQHPSSVMHGNKENLKKDTEWALKLRCEFFSGLSEPELEREAVNSLLNVYIYSTIGTPRRFDKNFISFLKKYWFTNKLRRNSRIKIILFFLSPRLFNRFMSSL